MTVAKFKDLCVDAVELDPMADFWADALGLRRDPAVRTGLVKLVGDDAAQTVWVNEAPETKTVKNRIHLDVHASSPAALTGAKSVAGDSTFLWQVMTDPDGGEFCVFSRDVVPSYRLYELVVDSVDPRAQATWWAAVLGGHTGGSEEGWHWVEQVPGMPFESLVFVPVPEPKMVKNRVHWDVDTDAGADAPWWPSAPTFCGRRTVQSIGP